MAHDCIPENNKYCSRTPPVLSPSRISKSTRLLLLLPLLFQLPFVNGKTYDGILENGMHVFQQNTTTFTTLSTTTTTTTTYFHAGTFITRISTNRPVFRALHCNTVIHLCFPPFSSCPNSLHPNWRLSFSA